MNSFITTISVKKSTMYSSVISLSERNLFDALASLLSHFPKLAISLLIVLGFIALIDFMWQKYQHIEKLKMTHKEVKDENKDTDGNPEVKQKIRRLQNEIGRKVSTSVIQPKVLEKALRRCDVAIGAISAPNGRTPCIVNEDMVKKMKAGAVIVDVSIDKGGCFETSKITTHQNPTFLKHDVIHYCVPNIGSRVSRTASYSLSNIFSPLLIQIADSGGCEKLIQKSKGFRHGVYIYNGTITSSILGEAFELPYKDLDLLISAL